MRILIVDDEARFANVLARVLKSEAVGEVDVASSAEEALVRMQEHPCDLLVTDLRLGGMSGLELMGEVRRRWGATDIVLMTAFAEVATAREALKRGAMDYLVKPFDNKELVALVAQAHARRRATVGTSGSTSIEPDGRLAGLIGESPAMRRVFGEIERVARADASVLLLGESGTGKEVAARALHTLSPRHSGPFIEVHIAALPESTLESELFGHEKGSFTGADKRKAGMFELASGGTVFLDEIGELPLHIQPKLLRFLQERRYYRIGGTEPLSVDVRVVAATNRDLVNEVKQGRFREDLYYRLDVVTITMPPLRERAGDVGLLARHLLARKHAGCSINDEALLMLETWRWPGNVRELANTIERAVILADGGRIEARHLPERFIERTPLSVVATTDGFDHSANERQLIEQALVQAGGNKTKAAELLGITRRRLYSRLKLLGMGSGEEEGE
ncbi:MAG: sigma-54-dependent Fis family transcriptional regulator [Planctomycetes bacterium]|nr:sigma-54-dependent Fis family transcriptional regulator [Planctomycetota bacterium]